MWGSRRAIDCDLESSYEDLGAQKLRNGGLVVWCFCERREEVEIRGGEGGEGVGVVVCVA